MACMDSWVAGAASTPPYVPPVPISKDGKIYKSPRAVRRHTCRECGTPLWTAVHADVMGWPVSVDARVFLSADGELRALERGRQTYRWKPPPKARIERRPPWRLETEPAGGRDQFGTPVLIVVSHVCNRPAPIRFLMEPLDPDGRQVEVEQVDPGEPPF